MQSAGRSPVKPAGYARAVEHDRSDLSADDLGVTPDPEHAEHGLLGDAAEVDGSPEERVDDQLQAEQDRDEA
jgi:hypothetical protein